MDETKNQANVLRQLLTKWAELEPERCRFTTAKNLITREREDLEEIRLIDSAGRWPMVLSDALGLDLEEDNFMRIQWAVQQAIVSRGWIFNLERDGGEWYVWIHDRWTGQDLNNPAKAVLEAYLAALEANK